MITQLFSRVVNYCKSIRIEERPLTEEEIMFAESKERAQIIISQEIPDEQKAQWFIGKLEEALQKERTPEALNDIHDLRGYLTDLCCDMANYHTTFGGLPHFTRETLDRAYGLMKKISREFQQTDVGQAATRSKRYFQREVIPYLPEPSRV